MYNCGSLNSILYSVQGMLTEALLMNTHNKYMCFWEEIKQEGHDGPVMLT